MRRFEADCDGITPLIDGRLVVTGPWSSALPFRATLDVSYLALLDSSTVIENASAFNEADGTTPDVKLDSERVTLSSETPGRGRWWAIV